MINKNSDSPQTIKFTLKYEIYLPQSAYSKKYYRLEIVVFKLCKKFWNMLGYERSLIYNVSIVVRI